MNIAGVARRNLVLKHPFSHTPPETLFVEKLLQEFLKKIIPMQSHAVRLRHDTLKFITLSTFITNSFNIFFLRGPLYTTMSLVLNSCKSLYMRCKCDWGVKAPRATPKAHMRLKALGNACLYNSYFLFLLLFVRLQLLGL